MDRALGDRSPGIFGLLRLLEEHGEAIEFDIPRYWPGRTLGDLPHALSWRELRTFVRHLPRESAYARSMHGELVEWGVTEHLQATAINDARVFNSGKKSLPDSKLIIPPKPPAAEPAAEPAAAARANGHKPVGGAAELDALFTGR